MPAFALFLTRAARYPTYVTICALALGFGIVRRAYLRPASLLVATVLAAWLASDAFKALFRRARPEYFYSIHETSGSYASGHATLALACYGFIAYVAWHSSLDLRYKRVVAIAAGIWTLGIGWSRLALGAHYPSDLLGGYLLAIGVLAVSTAAYDRIERDRRLKAAAAGRADAIAWR
ncbi:MAG: hypothetical protein NVS2B3_16780 [Vulcanimicrobiaceae bacterium]